MGEGPQPGSSSSACHVNPNAEDLLEALVMKNDIKFLAQSVTPLIKIEQPPRLQALIKTITSRIRAISQSFAKEKTRLEPDLRQESYPLIMEQICKQSDYLTDVINH